MADSYTIVSLTKFFVYSLCISSVTTCFRGNLVSGASSRSYFACSRCNVHCESLRLPVGIGLLTSSCFHPCFSQPYSASLRFFLSCLRTVFRRGCRPRVQYSRLSMLSKVYWTGCASDLYSGRLYGWQRIERKHYWRRRTKKKKSRASFAPLTTPS